MHCNCQPLPSLATLCSALISALVAILQEETLDPNNQTQGDTKEGFYFGREVPLDSSEAQLPLHGPNQWPDRDRLPEFREVTDRYFEVVKGLGFRYIQPLFLGDGGCKVWRDWRCGAGGSTSASSLS